MGRLRRWRSAFVYCVPDRSVGWWGHWGLAEVVFLYRRDEELVNSGAAIDGEEEDVPTRGKRGLRRVAHEAYVRGDRQGDRDIREKVIFARARLDSLSEMQLQYLKLSAMFKTVLKLKDMYIDLKTGL